MYHVIFGGNIFERNADTNQLISVVHIGVESIFVSMR